MNMFTKRARKNDQQDGKQEKPLPNGSPDVWTWSRRHRSQEVVLTSGLRRAYFHPNWSKGTAGVRGTHIINNGRHYWEIHVSNRIFGTSMMFGIGTDEVRLSYNRFCNLLGEDGNSWALSHKGLVWHRGIGYIFTKRFVENEPTKIGMLFDGINGTLTYYKDGKCLGVAFHGLNKINKPLYPIVSSSAAKTELFVTEQRREFVSLQDRCRAEILKHITDKEHIGQLDIPQIMVRYLQAAMPSEQQLIPVDNYDLYKV